jgi:hypothetical protein
MGTSFIIIPLSFRTPLASPSNARHTAACEPESSAMAKLLLWIAAFAGMTSRPKMKPCYKSWLGMTTKTASQNQLWPNNHKTHGPKN